MTTYRKDPDAISNWFNALLDGVGHRGSSFTDIDSVVVAALTHDGRSRRFLFQEFKRPHEETLAGQWWALYDLARQPNTTVWHLRQCEDLLSIEFTAFREVPKAGLLTASTIPVAEYRQRFSDWWNHIPEGTTENIEPRVVWSEYVQRDPSLRAFVDAEIARACIAIDTEIHNSKHWHDVAVSLHDQLNQQKRGAR